MENEDCNTGLSLGLSIGDHYVPKEPKKHNYKSGVSLNLSFTLCPKQEEKEDDDDEKNETINPKGSSFRAGHEDDHEEGYANNKRNDCISFNNKSINRKKLRLTRDQSSLLEDSFKLHNTLNPIQKHALAERLDLTPRQVEVWFQNRRARTKLKQTEVDCEFMKKCCESLSDENTRLKKELQELRSLKRGRSTPLCLHLPMCPSCEKNAGCGPQEKQ